MKKSILILSFIFVSFVSKAQYTSIPDPNFEQALIDLGLDSTLNGQVLTTNIEDIISINVMNSNIADLTGIEDFSALEELICNQNQLTDLNLSNNTELETLISTENELSNLDISANVALTFLDCRDNNLTSLDVTSNTELEILNCGRNELTSLDLSMNTDLKKINFGYNQLTSIDVSNNLLLEQLFFIDNQISELDISVNTELQSLGFDNNQIADLDISNNLDIGFLTCDNNMLTSLNVSNHPITWLTCESNQLTSLDLRNDNNSSWERFRARFNPELTCIFVDNAYWSTQNWSFVDPASTFVNNEADCAQLDIIGNAFAANVKLYPNPSSGQSKINLGKAYRNVTIKIMNVLGKIVDVYNFSSTQYAELNTSDYQSGIHFIQIKTENNMAALKLIVE